MSKPAPMVIRRVPYRRCKICRAAPAVVEWVHESLQATLDAGLERPFARTIWQEVRRAEEFKTWSIDWNEDNMREHLHRHEPLWYDWPEKS